jgi:hypothetical protein
VGRYVAGKFSIGHLIARVLLVVTLTDLQGYKFTAGPVSYTCGVRISGQESGPFG